MKLTFRLLLLSLLAISVVTGIYGYLAVQREEQIFAERAQQEVDRLYEAMHPSILDNWNDDSPKRVEDLMADLQRKEYQVQVRWVWFDASNEDPFAPSASCQWETLLVRKMFSVPGVGSDGDSHLFTYLPVKGKQRPGGLEFGRSMADLNIAKQKAIAKTLGLLIALMVAASLAVLGFGLVLVGRPMRRLIEKTRRIGEGDLDDPLELHRSDELGELAASINEMCARLRESNLAVEAETTERIAAMEQLRHADRLRTVGRLASGIAHELGTPLNVISGRASMIASDQLDAQAVRESATAIHKEAERMTTIIRQLLDFARRREPQRADVDLRKIVEQTIQLLSPLASKKNVKIRFEAPDAEQLACVDMSQIQQVLTNIIVNGIQAIEGSGEVDVTIESVRQDSPEPPAAAGAEFIKIAIRDTGSGVDDQDLQQIFEPFYTTKEVGEGTGLGLSIAYRIMQEHGGWIDVENDAQRAALASHSTSRSNRIMANPESAHRAIPRILVVDDEASMCELIDAAMSNRGFEVTWRTSPAEAFDLFEREPYDVVLTDLKMKGADGIELCERMMANRPDVPVIVMTAFGSMETAIAAIRAGAYDFVTKPFELDLLALTLQRAATHRELQHQVRLLSQAVEQSKRDSFAELLGESRVMQQLYDTLGRISDSEASVLITGESGSGKEMAARAIHRKSRRSDAPFVAVNCAALPESLLESELFGHAKGAFTDARSDRDGLFVQANGGTLFLDEVGDMPLNVQPKLLRALEENVVRPVGGNREQPFDVRLLTATNRDLDSAVEQRRFREDLFYRINVIQVELPPLRARGTDVLLLTQHFLRRFAESSRRDVTGISEPTAEKLLSYNWPGNVRELRNVIERAVALTRYDKLAVDDLPEKIRDYRSSQVIIGGEDPAELLPLEAVEHRYIQHVLEMVDGNKTLAAKILGLDRKTLYRKLKQTPGA